MNGLGSMYTHSTVGMVLREGDCDGKLACVGFDDIEGVFEGAEETDGDSDGSDEGEADGIPEG